MRCNNELSLIHFCKEITGYFIASINYCFKLFKRNNDIIETKFTYNTITIYNKIIVIYNL